MIQTFLYFWSGNSSVNNTIPEGNYNDVIVSNTNLTTGAEKTSGIDWNDSKNSPYRNRPYQQVFFSNKGNFEFTLGSNNCDTLIVRYLGNDQTKEEIYKKLDKKNEKFIVKNSNGKLEIVNQISKIEVVVTTESHELKLTPHIPDKKEEE